MKYAEVSDVEAGFRPLDTDEKGRCDALLEEAPPHPAKIAATIVALVTAAKICLFIVFLLFLIINFLYW